MENLSERVKRVKQSIDLAVMLIDDNNWNSALAIVHGLICKSVIRLHNTWNALNDTYKQKMEYLKQLLDEKDCFGVLRRAMQQQPLSVPTIPYLGLYLSSLQQLSILKQQHIIIPKCKQLHLIISEILWYQSCRKYYYLEVNKLNQALWDAKSVDEEKFHAMSIKAESTFGSMSFNFLSKLNNNHEADIELKMNDRLPKSKSLPSNDSIQLSSSHRDSLVFSNNDFIIEKKDINELEKIGEGAQGVVLKGSYFGTIVAVKYFSKQIAQAEIDYFNELNLLAKVSFHTNIVRFFGMTSDSKKLGIVSEFCEGRDLFKLLCQLKQGTQTLSRSQKLKILSGVAAGMQYLHHKNIIHRDLKCENILLDCNWNPKIADFGLSKIIKENRDDHLLVGTPAFCAPEVLLVKDRSQLVYSPKVDIYSFGIIMFIMWTETVYPYGKLVTVEQLISQFSKDIEYRPNVPSEFSEEWVPYVTLMRQCWHRSSEARPTFQVIHQQLIEMQQTQLEI